MRLPMLPVMAVFMLQFSNAFASEDCGDWPVQNDASVAAIVNPIVDQALQDGFAGGVAIVRDGELVYNRVAGFADREGRVPVTGDTLFHVASMTKYLTAMLVLLAVDEERIALDEPVGPYLEGTDLAARGVTFLDLLTHRTGLGSSYVAEGISDPDQAVLAIDASGIDESRAGQFRYSNDGYDLLAIILEEIYEEPYEELVREKLLTPGCVQSAGFWGSVDLEDPQVVSQPLTELPTELLGRNYGMLGSSGFLVTAEGLARLQLALDNFDVLEASSVEALLLPRDEISIGATAMGAFIIENPVLGPTISVRGYEDWGDNGYLNDYRDCGIILAVVTSRGPAEASGKPPFRDSISSAIEEQVLANLCERNPG